MRALFKKKISIVVCFMVMILTMGTIVSASHSGWHNSPSSIAGSWAVGYSYSCQTSEPKALGSLCLFYYRNPTSLQSNFANNSNRTISVQLKEEDDWPNDHDLIKTYDGTFSGLNLDTITLSKTHISGAVDNNSAAELYIKYKVDKVSGDPTTPSIADGLFEYNLVGN